MTFGDSFASPPLYVVAVIFQHEQLFIIIPSFYQIFMKCWTNTLNKYQTQHYRKWFVDKAVSLQFSTWLQPWPGCGHVDRDVEVSAVMEQEAALDRAFRGKVSALRTVTVEDSKIPLTCPSILHNTHL